MNEQIKKYIENYPAEIVDMFKELRQLIYDSVSFDFLLRILYILQNHLHQRYSFLQMKNISLHTIDKLLF